MASANASVSVNFYGQAIGQSASAATTYFGGSAAVDVPTGLFGTDLGAIETTAVQARQACTFQESTVVKAIHALCEAPGVHEFPASHMVADTWIQNGFEGEVARCLPGTRLKVVLGKVIQSSEGLAAGYASSQVLECSAGEAVRHYKDGVLKCAPALKVPDCTERTNLRKYGSGDMFFTYRAKICLETQEEYSQPGEPANYSQRSTLELRGAY